MSIELEDAISQTDIVNFNILETNIKEKTEYKKIIHIQTLPPQYKKVQRNLWYLNEINNPQQNQDRGSGIINMTNMKDTYKYLTKLNNEKNQIIKQYISYQKYIIIINIHNEQNDMKFVDKIQEIHKENILNIQYVAMILNMDTNFTKRVWNKKIIKELCQHKISTGNNHIWNDMENELCATFLIQNPKTNIEIEIQKQQVIEQNMSDHHILKQQIIFKNLKIEEIKMQRKDFINNAETKEIQLDIRMNHIMEEPNEKNLNECMKKLKEMEKIRANKKKEKIYKIQDIRQMNQKFENLNKEIKKKIYENLAENLRFSDRWKNEIDKICQLRITDPREYYKKCKNIFAIRQNANIIDPYKSPLFIKEEAIFDENRKQDIMDKFFEDTFKSKSLPENQIELLQEDIEWLLEQTPNFSYRKEPGMDGLMDVMFQPPKAAGPFQTIFENTQTERERQENNHLINIKNITRKIIQQIQTEKESIYAQGRQIYIVKKECDKSIEECRPISILPLFIKLIEDMIYQKIKKDLQLNKIEKINVRQTGFQENKTTTINILKATEFLKKNTNKFVVYYDFKGAFNTPEHEMMFEKVLPKRGFCNRTIKWIRWIYYKAKLNERPIKYGTLQGSKLSPVLFIHYLQETLDETMEEMKKRRQKIEYFLYADDLVIGETIDDIQTFDQIIIQKTEKYKLKINKNKTEMQYITNKKEKKLKEKEELMQRTLKEYKVTRNFTYLGQQITSKINMDENIKRMKKQLARFTCLMMNMYMKNIDLINRIALWRTFIRSQFLYGISIIKRLANKTQWKQINSMYNGTLRAALAVPRSTNLEKIWNLFKFKDTDQTELRYRNHLIKQLKQMNENDNIKLDIGEETIINQQEENEHKEIQKKLLKIFDKLDHYKLKIYLTNPKQKIFKCLKCQQQENIEELIEKHSENKVEDNKAFEKIMDIKWNQMGDSSFLNAIILQEIQRETNITAIKIATNEKIKQNDIKQQ